MGAMTDDGREARGDRTREALVRAGRDAFVRRGFAGASVRDIADAAGCNSALVRYHFGGKDGLWQAVLEEGLAALRMRVEAAIGQACTPREAFLGALGAWIDHLEADPGFPRLVARGVLDGDPEVLRVTTAQLAPLLAVGTALGAERDALITVFGATVVPWLYTPVLEQLLGDPLASEALASRRRHLEELVSRLIP